MTAEGADISRSSGRPMATTKIPVDRPFDRKLKGNFPKSRDFTETKGFYSQLTA